MQVLSALLMLGNITYDQVSLTPRWDPHPLGDTPPGPSLDTLLYDL